MDATLLFKTRFVVECKSGRVVMVYMDLFRLPPGHPDSYPEGLRFSWIAFDPDDDSLKVLFDCHDPKGAHIHINNGKPTPIKWTSVDDAQGLFFSAIREVFGDFDI
ncbi:MAG: hypothetical protein A2583_05130 [Bdellovibrionales bacterium RIFOXYD1_FULL_53_11]|nr:MAG: hypothetical protein A2583_05130 [Bdellovibrionales bacterium RIFOXYD1_FULL_53_11]